MRVVRKKTDGERALDLVNEIRDEINKIKDEGGDVEKVVLTEDEYKLLKWTVWGVLPPNSLSYVFSYPIEIEKELI